MPSSRRDRDVVFAAGIMGAMFLMMTFSSAPAAPRDVPAPTQGPPPAGDSAQAQQEQLPLSDETAAEMKRVIQMLRQLLREDDPQVRIAAIQALAMLEWRDESIGDEFRHMAVDPDPLVRDAALRALLSGPEMIATSLHLLIERLGDETTDFETQIKIEKALIAHVSPAASVPAAIAALESDSTARQRGAIQLLTELGATAKDALPALLVLATSPESNAAVRPQAIQAAGTITNLAAREEIRVRALMAEVKVYTDDTMKRSDTNGNGMIDGSEEVVLNRSLTSSTGVKAGELPEGIVFMAVSIQSLDKDADGFVSRLEVAQYYEEHLEARRNGREARAVETYPATGRSGRPRSGQ